MKMTKQSSSSSICLTPVVVVVVVAVLLQTGSDSLVEGADGSADVQKRQATKPATVTPAGNLTVTGTTAKPTGITIASNSTQRPTTKKAPSKPKPKPPKKKPDQKGKAEASDVAELIEIKTRLEKVIARMLKMTESKKSVKGSKKKKNSPKG